MTETKDETKMLDEFEEISDKYIEKYKYFMGKIYSRSLSNADAQRFNNISTEIVFVALEFLKENGVTKTLEEIASAGVNMYKEQIKNR